MPIGSRNRTALLWALGVAMGTWVLLVLTNSSLAPSPWVTLIWLPVLAAYSASGILKWPGGQPVATFDGKALLLALAYFSGSIAWAVFVTPHVPNSNLGVAIVFLPGLSLGFTGAYYFSKAFRLNKPFK